MPQSLQSQHTLGFPEFLQKAGVAVVLSTYQAGKLVVLRNDGGKLNTHFIHMEKTHGHRGPRWTPDRGDGLSGAGIFQPARGRAQGGAGRTARCLLPAKTPPHHG